MKEEEIIEGIRLKYPPELPKELGTKFIKAHLEAINNSMNRDLFFQASHFDFKQKE